MSSLIFHGKVLFFPIPSLESTATITSKFDILEVKLRTTAKKKEEETNLFSRLKRRTNGDNDRNSFIFKK
jgi:hypothetical protein